MGSSVQVGRAFLSADEAKGTSQGRLLELLHVFGDCLWGLASGGPVPNAGFNVAAGCVAPLQSSAEVHSQQTHFRVILSNFSHSLPRMCSKLSAFLPIEHTSGELSTLCTHSNFFTNRRSCFLPSPHLKPYGVCSSCRHCPLYGTRCLEVSISEGHPASRTKGGRATARFSYCLLLETPTFMIFSEEITKRALESPLYL